LGPQHNGMFVAKVKTYSVWNCKSHEVSVFLCVWYF